MGKYKIEAGQVYISGPNYDGPMATCEVLEIFENGRYFKQKLIGLGELKINTGDVSALEHNIAAGIWILATPLIRELV